MKLYILRPRIEIYNTKDDTWSYECVEGFVVRANSEEDARKFITRSDDGINNAFGTEGSEGNPQPQHPAREQDLSVPLPHKVLYA